ncbi:MAG: DNA repair protein RecO [Anaerolineae bacterium]|nr:DNA repair protein RecO [Anaerolineae bacterium]
MGSERLYRTEGIVVRRRNQGEADRVLTLCTPLGKLDVVAKGARKVRSRKAGHIELFCRSNFVIARSRSSWDIVSQAETVEPHAALREDLLRGTHARYAVELFDRFFTEGEGGQAVFDLLDHVLTWLCSDDDLDLIARFHEQHLLGLAGFRPELFRCVGEHEHEKHELEEDKGHEISLQPREANEEAHDDCAGRLPYGFDPEHGGALCPDCYEAQKRRPEVMALSPNGLAFLQDCQRGPYTTRLRAMKIAPTLHAEVERVMQHYITYHLERSVSSGAFLRKLKREITTR